MSSIVTQIIHSHAFDILSLVNVLLFLLPFFLLFDQQKQDEKKVSKKEDKKIGKKEKQKTGKKEKTEEKSKGYIILINVIYYIGIISHIGLAAYTSALNPKFILLHFEIHDMFRALGIIISLLFAIVYVWSLLLLEGKSRIENGFGVPRKLAKDGPYSESRHPLCIASSLISAGTALALESPAMLISSIFIGVGSVLSALNEEKILRLELGKAHIQYCNKVRRFLPKNWKKYLL
ncbi:MAG: hypothetical protein EZS28_048411 [Streblomastix strix]|uniref:Isoprenylcysteine carboxylmethyltransferase family protein n=1 Tax=Streblomastix strix TaxID=222440 RepID=A0A5J4TDM4_9EUKA|nr:MAG: hypothetical protein EZS28_048411 [Streblomastix strix]